MITLNDYYIFNRFIVTVFSTLHCKLRANDHMNMKIFLHLKATE